MLEAMINAGAGGLVVGAVVGGLFVLIDYIKTEITIAKIKRQKKD